MRPARFEAFLKELYERDAQVKEVVTVGDAGYGRHPYGLVVTYTTGARTLLQVVAISREGDRFDEPEDIVEGDAPAPVELPEVFDGGKVKLANVDRHLAALVVNSGSREVASAEAFSVREKPGAVRYGTKITFHDSSRILVYVVHALPAGRDGWPQGREFDVPAAV